MFTDGIDERAIIIAEYVSATGATVRSAAQHFGVSKSTVHKDLTERLKHLDFELYMRVSAILAHNRAQRHLRGGEATKRKYEKSKNN